MSERPQPGPRPRRIRSGGAGRSARAVGVLLLVTSATVVLLPAPWRSAALAAWPQPDAEPAEAAAPSRQDRLDALLDMSDEELVELRDQLNEPAVTLVDEGLTVSELLRDDGRTTQAWAEEMGRGSGLVLLRLQEDGLQRTTDTMGWCEADADLLLGTDGLPASHEAFVRGCLAAGDG